jgi:hypothetical protein
MIIPIDRSDNDYTPECDYAELIGTIVLSTSSTFPKPQGKPWLSHCRPFTKPFNKAFCMLAHDAGQCQMGMFIALEQLTKDHVADTTNTQWQAFLDNNPDANRHYTEFAGHFKNLADLFRFKLTDDELPFPLSGKYEFRTKQYHSLPPVWGAVEFFHDEATGAPIRFVMHARNHRKKFDRLDTSSSSSSIFAARSSSSIPGRFVVDPRGNLINPQVLPQKPAAKPGVKKQAPPLPAK